ncbi:MAG: hypothetical protein KGZ70_12870 [Hydrogenophaga sp.]|nr:hypothetical protein [Hydrogenophaga sp.]
MNKHSSGEWASETALSSDLHHVRYITADGRRIASVCLRNGMPQEEAIANATLLASANKMLQALEEVSTMLSQHPDFKVGDSKVHYLAHKAARVLAQAKGQRR